MQIIDEGIVNMYAKRQEQLKRALQMRSLKPPKNSKYASTQTGYYYAARYLANRGWTIEAALLLLCGGEACARYNYRGIQS